MKYNLLLLCGIAPLLLITVLSVMNRPKQPERPAPPPPPNVPVDPGNLNLEKQFYGGLVNQLNRPLRAINPGLEAPPECAAIGTVLKDLNITAVKWRTMLAVLQPEEDIRDLCGMELRTAKATLNAIPIDTLPEKQRTLAQKMITRRVAIVDDIEGKVKQALEVNDAWVKGKELYGEGLAFNDGTSDDGPDGPKSLISSGAGQACKKFEEAGEEFKKVKLEVFQQQRCEAQDLDLTMVSLANFIQKATFMKDATCLVETFNSVYPTKPSENRSKWNNLIEISTEAIKDYVSPGLDIENPSVDPIPGIDPAEYARMIDNHRNILAKDKLSRIEPPKTICELGIWLEKVKEAFKNLDDPKLKEAIRKDLIEFLTGQIQQKTYPQPVDLMPFTMMVDKLKTVDGSPGVVVISEKWKNLNGTAPNRYFEFKKLDAKQLALLYVDKTFSAKAMKTGYVFESAFIRTNAQPEPLSPLVAHRELTNLINDITMPGAPIHMRGTWDTFKTTLDEQLKKVKAYRDRGGRDFGAVESFTMLVSFSDGVLNVFDTTEIGEILKPPPQP